MVRAPDGALSAMVGPASSTSDSDSVDDEPGTGGGCCPSWYRSPSSHSAIVLEVLGVSFAKSPVPDWAHVVPSPGRADSGWSGGWRRHRCRSVPTRPSTGSVCGNARWSSLRRYSRSSCSRAASPQALTGPPGTEPDARRPTGAGGRPEPCAPVGS
jgi:hypothetical protein